MRNKKYWIFSLLLMIPQISWGWNALLHQVIPMIAYEHLEPNARQQVDKISKQFKVVDPTIKNFAKLGLWPDKLRAQGVTAFNSWHYIVIPYNPESIKIPYQTPEQNIVWAILQSQETLAKKQANTVEEAMFLSFLNHFVADIHQPLHTTSLYNSKFPKGDKGGNLFAVKAPYADNLHAYWDQGLNFSNNYYKNYPLSTKQMQQLAQRLQNKYPIADFKQALLITDPQQWAKEGHQIAIKNVYTLNPGTTPSKRYRQQGQVIAEQQVVLAGYRLANMLNQLYAK